MSSSKRQFMRISGFTFARNAAKLYYPVKEAILSILPLVDEFVIALGDNDKDDFTLSEIESIDSEKIKIIHTVWDLEKYPRGMEHAHQTDIAKAHCTGDWLFYLQADEVIHEACLPVIRARCEKYLTDLSVEGFLFHYIHFWGDYDHHVVSHGWYKKEIRIVRNHPDIHSWISAQSFRFIQDFDGVSYRSKEGTRKLHVIDSGCKVYHYGWVRPPHLMQKKRHVFSTNHRGKALADQQFKTETVNFDYGDMDQASSFAGTHPEVMKQRIKAFYWGQDLALGKHSKTPHKHQKLKNKLLTWFEENINRGEQIFTFKNYKLLKNK